MPVWSDDIKTDQGPHKVLLKRHDFVDNTRQNDDGSIRTVPVKLYHPADYDGERLPLILWSHGFGGNRDGAGFISRYLASHGYHVLHMTHHGTDSSLWEGKDGHPWDILRNTKVSRTTTLNRFRDAPFILDALPNWLAEMDGMDKITDLDNIGMSGHSFGALSTQVAAGQLFMDENNKALSLPEPRIKAGILYSPVPVAEHLLAEAGNLGDTNIYEPINIPLLHMTGTKDDAPIGGMDYTHRLKVFENTGHDEKYLLVKDGADHMVYNGTRGKLEKNEDRDAHEEMIKVMALAYWDAKLKGDSAAQDWLDQGAEAYLNGRATLTTS